MRLKTKSMRVERGQQPDEEPELVRRVLTDHHVELPALTSPATRPTPTTDIGESMARSSPLKAACQTPTIFCGIRMTAPAVLPQALPDDSGDGGDRLRDIDDRRRRGDADEAGGLRHRLPVAVQNRVSLGVIGRHLVGDRVTVRLTCSPWRSTTMAVGWSRRGRISLLTSALEVTGLPSMEMTLSIGFSPAAAAGVPGRPSQVVAVAASVTGTTHWATEATREPLPGLGGAWMVTMPVSRLTAISKVHEWSAEHDRDLLGRAQPVGRRGSRHRGAVPRAAARASSANWLNRPVLVARMVPERPLAWAGTSRSSECSHRAGWP